MKTSSIRRLLAIAALAAVAGCVSPQGYQLPDYRAPGGGWNPAYPPYVSGYGAGYGYDSRYYDAYGRYDPYYFSSGVPGPYYYGYYPYPRYVVVPCVDNNRDGHCDRHPGHHDDGNGQGGQGHGNGDHDGNGNHHGNHGGDHDGQQHQGSGSAAPPLQQNVAPRVQPRVAPPSAPPTPVIRPQPIAPTTSGAAIQPEPPLRVRQDAPDDRPARSLNR